MKIGKWAGLLLLGTPFLAGCANFWQAPTNGGGSTGCTTNCSTATSGGFYILNTGTTSQILGYSIVSGALTALSGSPYAVTGTPTSIAVAPSGSFLYVATNAGVFLYPINSGGVLGTAASVSTDLPFAIGVDGTGAWLVEAILGTGGVLINAVPITSTGAYASPAAVQSQSFSVTAPGPPLNQMAISQDNSYIFIALGTGGTLVVPFNANVSTTSPNPLGSSGKVIQPKNSGGSALSVAVDPAASPRVFYIGETLATSAASSGALRVFNYSALTSGSVSELATSPIATGALAPNFVLPGASGSYVYVASSPGTSSTGSVVSFAITNSGTTAAPAYAVGTGSTVSAGTYPIGLAEDSTGTFLLGVNGYGSPYFDSYTFDTTTLSSLDIQVTASTGASPIAIVAAP